VERALAGAVKTRCISARVTCRLIARGPWQDGGKGSVGIEVNRVTSDFLSVGRGKGAIVRERDRCARTSKDAVLRRNGVTEEIVLYDFMFRVTLKKFNSDDRYGYRLRDVNIEVSN